MATRNSTNNSRIFGKGLTFDDVLLMPAYSEILPSEVIIHAHLTKNIQLHVPILSSAMDTVTEANLAIALAREGGIGILHKNMSIERQAEQVRKVKRSESGMIVDPITLEVTATIGDALKLMKENKIGGIPIVAVTSSVMGSTIMPLSLRFTLRTCSACLSILMFLCKMPMPPSRASAIAKLASVTVSIAEDKIGTCN